MFSDQVIWLTYSARLAGINVGGPARIYPSADFGLIGLAVMGQNLILNVADHDFTVVVYNRTVEKVDRFLDNEAKGSSIFEAISRGSIASDRTQTSPQATSTLLDLIR